MRGGAEAPLTASEIEKKFMENAQYGGWTATDAERVLLASRSLFAQPALDLLGDLRK